MFVVLKTNKQTNVTKQNKNEKGKHRNKPSSKYSFILMFINKKEKTGRKYNQMGQRIRRRITISYFIEVQSKLWGGQKKSLISTVS